MSALAAGCPPDVDIPQVSRTHGDKQLLDQQPWCLGGQVLQMHEQHFISMQGQVCLPRGVCAADYIVVSLSNDLSVFDDHRSKASTCGQTQAQRLAPVEIAQHACTCTINATNTQKSQIISHSRTCTLLYASNTAQKDSPLHELRGRVVDLLCLRHGLDG